jgi:acyl-CoA synthetase (AMP-forming)/AMP-acid ligase II/thioesterase domain-containing protein
MQSDRPSGKTAPFKLGRNETVDELFGPIDTLGQLIRANAQRAPSAACVVSAAGDLLSWQQLLAQLERTHTALRAFGFGANDRIALVLANGPTLAVAFLTVAACAACAPLNPVYGADEFTYYLSDLKAQALIASEDAAGFAIDAAAQLGIPVLELEPDGSAPGLFTLKGNSPANKRAAGVVTSDSVALFLHTSGTTSRPKLVPLRHRNLIASACNMIDALELSPADRCLNLMPLFHIHGLVGGLLAPLAAAGSAVCPPNSRPGDFFRWLNTTRPSWYTAVPTMHRAIVADAVGQEDVIERCPLRFIRSSSAPMPARLFDELSQIFRVPVLEAYSMTEAAHQMTCNPLSPGKQKPGTVGLPAGPEVALLDESGRLLPAGETGEVVIRGPTVMSGYEANPEANAEAFVNGWFRTGDQGRFDSDGYLMLTGRLKEQINRGGEKISPLEIDQVLLRHSDVSEAATFGFPHPTLGEEIAAAVVLRAQSNAAPTQLQAFLREHLAPFKIPRRILILDQMPKGPTGKIQRRQLSKILGLDAAQSRHKSSEPQGQVSALELGLLQLWRKMLDCNSIGLDDDFFEIGGDSLLAVQMLLEVEKIVGHSVPESILVDHSTIQQLAQGVAELDSSRARPLIQVQSKGDRPPFFFFHGDYNGGYYTRRLARLLGPDQPFISVTPHKLGPEPIPRSIEQMAVERLPPVLAVQPQGPFRLGGYCNAAVVALEVARMLVGAGHRVELIVLIDSPTLNLRPTARILFQSIARILNIVGEDREQVYRRLAFAMDVLWRQLSNLEIYWRNSRRSLQRGLSELFGHAGAPTDRSDETSRVAQLPEELARRDRELARINNRLFRNYFPKEIEVPLIYFSAEYDGGPLRNLGPRVEVVSLPGGHWGCITTHVEVLAGHLRCRLEELNRAHSASLSQFSPPIQASIKQES